MFSRFPFLLFYGFFSFIDRTTIIELHVLLQEFLTFPLNDNSCCCIWFQPPGNFNSDFSLVGTDNSLTRATHWNCKSTIDFICNRIFSYHQLYLLTLLTGNGELLSSVTRSVWFYCNTVYFNRTVLSAGSFPLFTRSARHRKMDCHNYYSYSTICGTATALLLV